MGVPYCSDDEHPNWTSVTEPVAKHDDGKDLKGPPDVDSASSGALCILKILSLTPPVNKNTKAVNPLTTLEVLAFEETR